MHYYSGGYDSEGRIYRNTASGTLSEMSAEDGHLILREDGVSKKYRFYNMHERLYGRHEMVIEYIDIEGRRIWPPAD